MAKKERMKLMDKIKEGVSSNSRSGDGAIVRKSGGIFSKIKGLFQNDAMIETISDRRTWSDDWPENMQTYKDVYEQVSIVRKCINLVADFTVSIGFDIDVDDEELQNEIKDMWRRTNFYEVLKTGVKKREIWGDCAFEIIRDSDDKITDFVPLQPQKLNVIIDSRTMRIKHFEYNTIEQGTIKLDKEDVFYIARDALDTRKTGVSALESIKTTIKRKWNLEKDMEQASKRLWAPYTIFKYDTSYVKDKEKQKKEVKKFISKIKPGKTIVHNQQVEPNIIDMTPDISSLNQAIRSADEEIIGNWGIPKALLSRERTEDMSTLEFSIQTLYEGPVKSIQQYLSNEIETQIYDKIADRMGKEDYTVNHLWKANKFKDSPTIRALTYAVKEGVISARDMVSMLGWNVKEVKDVDDEPREREPLPVDERPVTMDSFIEDKIKDVLEDYEGYEAVKEMEKEDIL